MSDARPLVIAVGILLFIGLVIPFFLGYFIDVSDVQTSPLINSTVEFVQDGIEIDLLGLVDFEINPFKWLGTTLHTHMVNSLTYLGIFPEFLIIFILILCTLTIVYSVFKLIRG